MKERIYQSCCNGCRKGTKAALKVVNRKSMLLLAAVCLFCKASSAGAGEYLTADVAELSNDFVPGEISISLEEPSFAEENIIFPSARIPKDPQVANTGKNNARVFLKVTIPVKKISLVLDQKKRQKQDTELFSFQVNEKWKYIREEETDDGKQYLFCYKEKLKPGQTTDPLFEELLTAPFAEGELPGETTVNVKIDAQAIQWEDADTMEEAYEKYEEERRG